MPTVCSYRLAAITAVVLALITAPTGCQRGDRPELADVSGRVTLDGQPLAGAEVTFLPEHGQASRAVTDEDGRYELLYLNRFEGAKLGKHRVTITTVTEHDPTELVPADFNDNTHVEVERGGSTFDFDL